MLFRSSNYLDANDEEADNLLSQEDVEKPALLESCKRLICCDDSKPTKVQEYNAKGGTSKDSFRVLGVEIGSWPRTSQYLFCVSGVVFFLLMYGILQEFVVMSKFKRSLGWFVTFLQLSGYVSILMLCSIAPVFLIYLTAKHYMNAGRSRFRSA
jgi:hypothetical protein